MQHGPFQHSPEQLHITVDIAGNITGHTVSQPWPFPKSLKRVEIESMNDHIRESVGPGVVTLEEAHLAYGHMYVTVLIAAAGGFGATRHENLPLPVLESVLAILPHDNARAA